jgi:hypothetical protein
MIMFIGVGNSLLAIKGMYFDYWFVLFTTACCANILGLNISASFNSAITVYILIPILLIPQLLLSGVIVKFDKLNPLLTSEKTVPMSGEMMTSRWAFEALAVDQFKNNKYEKQFYMFDKKMSVASFKKDYVIAKLKGKIDKAIVNYKDPKYTDETTSDLKLIRSEIVKEMTFTKKYKCAVLDKLEYGKFNEEVAAQTADYLNSVQQYYIKAYNIASNEKDGLITSLNKSMGGEKFLQMKNEYENESLSDLVKNSNTLADKILESEGELMQRTDPIFQDPSADSFIRAHFYAPRKVIFGKYFDTYWVNMCVIWFMTLTLIVALYFDLLKKVIDGAENLVTRITGGKKQD